MTGLEIAIAVDISEPLLFEVYNDNITRFSLSGLTTVTGNAQSKCSGLISSSVAKSRYVLVRLQARIKCLLRIYRNSPDPKTPTMYLSEPFI